ncbi:hypothetical protein JW865_06380 [Candidatus Bathyarchaeota archaeon]|nr:hypothetical protein [Candidatus Bathyarchaeota archaeon]
MNLVTSLKIADILILASARVKSTGMKVKSKTSIWEYTNFTMAAFFAILSCAGVFYAVQNYGISSIMVKLIFDQIAFFIPVGVTFSCIIFAVFYEFNQSTFNISLDAINWLPISASDYVLGSSICTLYFSLPILGLAYGASLILALMTNSLMVWGLSLFLGIVGGLIGGFATEILRALTNKASTTLFKKGGRASIIGRFILYMVFLSAFMIIFNSVVILQIAEWFNIVAGGAWFFPLFWPSLAVLSLQTNDLLMSLVYSSLSLLLAGIFFVTGSKIRERNWVPEPVSSVISSAETLKPLATSKGFLGFGRVEAKIIEKDFRGLIRRRELMVYLAVPFIMIIISIVSEGLGVLFDPAAHPTEKVGLFGNFGLGVIYLVYFLSIISIGQEGGAAINLLTAPIKPSNIARAKLISALILPLIIFALMILSIIIIVKPDTSLLMLSIVFGLSCITETSEVGLILGSRFVDYNEVPRARFVRPEGIIAGIIVVGMILLSNFATLWFAEDLELGVVTVPAQALMIAFLGLILNIAFLKILPSNIKHGLEKAPI